MDVFDLKALQDPVDLSPPSEVIDFFLDEERFSKEKAWHVSSASKIEENESGTSDLGAGVCKLSCEAAKGSDEFKVTLDAASFDFGLQQLKYRCKDASESKPPILKDIILSSHGNKNCEAPFSIVGFGPGLLDAASKALILPCKDSSDCKPPITISEAE